MHPVDPTRHAGYGELKSSPNEQPICTQATLILLVRSGRPSRLITKEGTIKTLCSSAASFGRSISNPTRSRPQLVSPTSLHICVVLFFNLATQSGAVINKSRSLLGSISFNLSLTKCVIMPRQHKIPFLALLLLSFLLNGCEAQAVDKDEVVWTTQSGWNDLKTCAKCKFDYLFCNWPGNLQGDIGCSTNACMCRASTLGQTLKKVSDSVLSACSNYDNQRDATSFLIAYCSDKGYTSIGSAVIASSTGAFTVTETVTVSVVTQTVLVSAVSSRSLSRPQIFSWAMIWCQAVIFGLVTPNLLLRAARH